MAMPNHIVQVSISVRLITGAPLPRARVRFDATGPDIDGCIVVPGPVSVTLDDNGVGVASVQSNAAGTQGQQTRVAIYSESGELKFDGLATVPPTNCNLHEILNLGSPAAIDDAQAAATAAQGYAASAATTLATAVDLATFYGQFSGATFDGGAPETSFTGVPALDGGTP